MAQARIALIGQQQFGIITRKQALESLSESQLDYLVRMRNLVPVHREVYRFAGSPPSKEAEILAAVLALGDNTVASHASAAALHRLPILIGAGPHVTVGTSCSAKRRGIHVHRSNLRPSHVTSVRGIPVTTIERTLLDLASECSPQFLATVLNETVVARRTTYMKLQALIRETGTRGRRGAEALRVTLEQHLPLPSVDSTLQLRVLEVIAKYGLPTPVVEYEVPAGGGRRYYIDIAWPDRKIAVEADGFGAHGTSRERFDRDRRRNNFLLLNGWRVVHIVATMTDAEIRDVLAPLVS